MRRTTIFPKQKVYSKRQNEIEEIDPAVPVLPEKRRVFQVTVQRFRVSG
jgi:hypothetical protein